MSITYARLRAGGWGLRSPQCLTEGSTVTVTTKAGEAKTEVVGRILWSGPDGCLATIQAPRYSGKGAWSDRKPVTP